MFHTLSTSEPEGLQVQLDEPYRANMERASALVRGLRTTLWVHGAQPHVIDDMDRQVRVVLEGNFSEKSWFDRAKYLLNLPMAEFLKRGC